MSRFHTNLGIANCCMMRCDKKRFESNTILIPDVEATPAINNLMGMKLNAEVEAEMEKVY